MTAGGSTAREAARLRAAARRGWWRTVLRWFGINATNRRLESAAARREQGSIGEQQTAALLARLPAGWTVLHDLAVPGRRFNLDHVLIPPSGAGVIVLDSKKWRRTWETTLIGGRVHCGPRDGRTRPQDRHQQVEAFAGYVAAVARALRMPGSAVLPVIVVHGSPVAGAGRLDVRVPAWERTVHVVSADRLLETLLGVSGGRDPVRAAQLAGRVAAALPPYDTAA